MRGVYTVNYSRTLNNGVTASMITIASPSSGVAVEILSVHITNNVATGLTTGTHIAGIYAYQSGTVPSSSDIVQNDLNYIVPHESGSGPHQCYITTGTGNQPSSSAAYDRQGFNLANGYMYIPTPEERPVISPGRCATIMMTNLGSSAFGVNIRVTFREIG